MWLLCRSRSTPLASLVAEKERQVAFWIQQVAERDARITFLSTQIGQTQALLESEKNVSVNQTALLTTAQHNLAATFQALSAQALQHNNSAFLHQAQQTFALLQQQAKGDLTLKEQAIATMIEPFRLTLSQFDSHLRELERDRIGAYAGIREQVEALIKTQEHLRGETAQLVRALRTPHVRGRWGELQVQRLFELSGLKKDHDYREQVSVDTDEGRMRPDILVYLPGSKIVVVDSKVPLEAYLDAINATDEATRTAHLKDHARQVRDHIAKLSRKAYHQQFGQSPEFVVLFLPGEVFFSAALEHDVDLIETGIRHNIILATPTTLIALLKAVAYGWQQEAIAENAQRISALGRDLHKSLSVLSAHWVKLGKAIGTTVAAYDEAVGSLEGNVMIKARRFVDLKAVAESEKDPIATFARVEKLPRQLHIPELIVLPDTTQSIDVEG